MKYNYQIPLIVLLLFSAINAHGSDYMVELFSQTYHEKMIPGNGNLKISHTWEVKSVFGNKVLILTGRDYNFRRWLKADSRKHKLWVAKIPDEGDDKFKYNMSVYVDVTQLQPVEDKYWACDDCRGGPPPIKPVPPPPPQAE